MLTVKNAHTVNTPPTELWLSTSTFVPPANESTVFGTLYVADENCCQTYVFSIVGGTDAAMFRIVNNRTLVGAAGASIIKGMNLTLLIQVDDGHGGILQQYVELSES